MSVLSSAIELLARRVPRWPYQRAVRRGQAMGRLLYRLDARHRRVALANLERVFPDRPEEWRRSTAIACYEQIGRTAFEMLWSPSLSDEAIERLVVDDGIDRLLEASRSGTGGILVSAHLGNWELNAVILARLGVPLISIARPLDDPGLESLLLRLRTRTGAEILPKQNAVRGALRALREGKIVAILNDQNTLKKEAVFVPYFDRLAATSPIVAHLHLRSGAPVFTGFAVPEGEGYRIRVDEPLPTPEGDRAEAVEAMTASITRRIEEAVREYPGCWFWMHDRWRERPGTSDSVKE